MSLRRSFVLAAGLLSFGVIHLQAQQVASPAEVIGPANAAVVIEEYSDFQCPYCAQHERQYGTAVDQWLRTQKGVRFEYYDVALRQHAAAAQAALAARCAGEQGAYHAVKRAIFLGQGSWSGLEDAPARLTTLARPLVRDPKAFDRCIAKGPGALSGTLAANLARAKSLGVPGTPTFVVRAGPRMAQIVDPASPDTLAKIVRQIRGR